MTFLAPVSESAAPVVANLFVNAATGSDSNTGTSAGAAWQTIQKAANTATAGQTVSIAAGTYQERVTFPNAGTAGNPIAFVCATNRACIVDGGTNGGTGWTQASGFPTGTFEKTNAAIGLPGGGNPGSDPVPAHVTIGDKQLVFVKPGYTPSTADYMTLADTSPEWDGITGACRNYGTTTRCRFQDLGNPNTKALKFGPQNIGTFHVSGSTKGYLTFDGFYFKNGFSCLIIENQAHHVTLQNSTCTNGMYGVWLNTGAHDTLLQNNTWFKNWIYADHGHHRYTAVSTPNLIQENIFFGMREASPIASSLYITDQGDNNKILNNTFDHTGAAGIDIYSRAYHGDASYTYSNTEIGYNSFNNCQDYCIQFQDADALNFQIHHNTFNTYYNGTRFGRILHSSSATGQQVYFHHNAYTNPDGCSACLRGGDLELSAVSNVALGILPNGGKFYYYHNTSNSADSSMLAYASGAGPVPQNLQNMFFVNNIYSPGKNWQLELGTNPAFMSRCWVGGAMGGGNGGGSTGSPPGYTTAPMQWNINSRIWANSETVFELPSGHSAINAGLDLSTTWTAGSAGSQPALPGMTPGNFIGAAPDLGANEFGD